VLAKLLAVALTVEACAIPVEEHGGLAPKPAAPDLVFVGAGAAVETVALVTRRPWWQQAAAVGALAWWVRVPRAGGRTEAAHLLVYGGAFPVWWFHLLVARHP
jgi:hypothetical protein